MEENTDNQNPALQKERQGEASPAEIEKEIEAVNKSLKPKNEFFAVKAWLMLFTLVFSASMVSGLYIIFYGSRTPVNTEVTEDDKTVSSKASSLFKISSKEEGAAVVKIVGVIQESTDTSWGSASRHNASSIAKRIRTLADKKEIKGLLLDINSPGGTVGAVQDIYSAVLYFKSQKKPVVALMRDVAASGGYYVAMAADKVIAQPGTMTGSIGVIMQAGNFEGLFDKIGIKFIPIKSGKHKDIGASYRPMTEEEQAILQEMILDTYQQFYDAVKRGRPGVTDETLKIFADGRIFTGNRAKTAGMIDDLGGEETAKEYLSSLTGIKEIKLLSPRVNNFFDIFSMSASGFENKMGLNKIEELGTPKVSYLWTY
jgi:protease-4